MPTKYDLSDLQAEAKRLTREPKTLVFCDDEGYGLIVPQHFPVVFLGRTPGPAMRKLRSLFKPKVRNLPVGRGAPYPPEMFTRIRMYLMLARQEILIAQEADQDERCSGPRDVLSIFSNLCAADNDVIKAQKARGFDDSGLLKEIREGALKRRGRK